MLIWDWTRTSLLFRVCKKGELIGIWVGMVTTSGSLIIMLGIITCCTKLNDQIHKVREELGILDKRESNSFEEELGLL